jgi:hypothetical protein
MTFTEAALEVLRSAGEPLHYKKITELAIERNLLSHVGKTPEVTMSSRLAMMVKKDRGQAPIIKVKPGVFAIRESALQGQSLSPAALAAISEVEGGLSSEESATAVDATAATGASVEEAPTSIKAPALPGADMFPEEEGDDDPILAGLEQESEGGERGGRRRRRRRRRGKGGEKGDGAEVSVRPEPAQPSNNRGRDRDRDSFREASNEGSRERARERHERNERNERNERHDRNDRSGRHDRHEREERNGEEALDWNRQPADGDLHGKDLADAVWMVLSRGDRVPHSFSRVAELLVRRGRLSGSPTALSPTIAAAVRADGSRSEMTRARPRFRLRGGKVSLSERQLPKSLVRAEQDLLSIADRYAAELRRALIQKLSELPTAGFAELLATWLNAEGVTALRAVRRPGSSGSELHFAGTRKSGSEEVRLAIVVQRSGRDIDREAVIDVRGALHHYGQATSAWIVTTGRITSGAREEAAAQAAACALFDGNALAAAMERLGVAMRRHVIPHHEIDYDLLESLGDVPEQRERREREQERERRQQNERFDRERKEQRARALPKAEEGDEVESDAEPLLSRKMRDADWDEDESHDIEIGSRDSIEPASDREPREEDAGEADESDDDVLPVTDEENDDEIGADDEDDEVEAFREELDDSDEEDLEPRDEDQDVDDDELENSDAEASDDDEDDDDDDDDDDEVVSSDTDESEDEDEEEDDEREPRTRS